MKYFLSVETPDNEFVMLEKLESAGLKLVGKRKMSKTGSGNFTEEELAQALETGERGEIYEGFIHLSRSGGASSEPPIPSFTLDEPARAGMRKKLGLRADDPSPDAALFSNYVDHLASNAPPMPWPVEIDANTLKKAAHALGYKPGDALDPEGITREVLDHAKGHQKLSRSNSVADSYSLSSDHSQEIDASLAMTGLGRRALEIRNANDRLAAEGRGQAADFTRQRIAQLDAGRR